uniref:guanylate cyclase n=1 Tax=Strongyloides venezuelensis TaxID=75913 RepID=A0A0K0F0Y2_STRVS
MFKILFIIIILLLKSTECQNYTGSLKIGLIFPYNDTVFVKYMGFQNSASAIMIALKNAKENHPMLDNINITFYWKFNDCLSSDVSGKMYDLITKNKIDVLFGPPCRKTLNTVTSIASYYKILTLLWGNVFLDMDDYSNHKKVIGSVMSSYIDMNHCLGKFLIMFKWTTISIIYQSDEDHLYMCDIYTENLLSTFTTHYGDIFIAYRKKISNSQSIKDHSISDDIKEVSRIIIMCFDDKHLFKEMILDFYDHGMNNRDYVYINIDANMDKYIDSENENIFKNDNVLLGNRDDEFNSMFMWMYHYQFYLGGGKNEVYEEIRRLVPIYMQKEPFLCKKECAKFNVSSVFAPYLFDASYIYFTTISKILLANDITNVSEITFLNLTKEIPGDYTLSTGEFTMSKNLTRVTKVVLSRYTQNGRGIVNLLYITRKDNDSTINLISNDLKNTIWYYRDGKYPLNVPECGYTNELCTKSFIEKSPIGFAAIIVGAIIIIIIILGVIIYMQHIKSKQQTINDSIWKIDLSSVKKVSECVSSSVRTISKISLDSSVCSEGKLNTKSMKNKTHILFVYENKKIVGEKHNVSYSTLNENNKIELRNMKMLSNANLNKFIGFNHSPTFCISFWGYCSRLSLVDIFQAPSLSYEIDAFFIYSLINDAIEGLNAIHNSPIKVHGNLMLTNCLVDERWQLKLSDFGLGFLRTEEAKDSRLLLWTAPELLKGEVNEKSKKTDIYSLSIVMADIMNNNISFENSDVNGGSDEVVYMLKHKKNSTFRPKLNPKVENLPIAMTHLVKDMWSQDPNSRPTIEVVKKLIKEMNPSKSHNLMDHVFNILENYASSLEEEITLRTQELTIEKKKADLLLTRMLPTQVIEKLKLGQAIQPETYDEATIFFSDIVSFTTLASKCTPLQVVDLLNSLYTLFDSTINEYDVYKVETIGDGYMCVSGLPNKNEHLHVKEISCLSIELVKKMKGFSIVYLPNENIRVRIGIHTGSCIACVVGLTMPKYCLFGNAVSLASKMESNGKANHIHMSCDAHKLLTEKIGGFVTQRRGEVIINGAGVFETYWLLGKEGEIIYTPEI